MVRVNEAGDRGGRRVGKGGGGTTVGDMVIKHSSDSGKDDVKKRALTSISVVPNELSLIRTLSRRVPNAFVSHLVLNQPHKPLALFAFFMYITENSAEVSIDKAFFFIVS